MTKLGVAAVFVAIGMLATGCANGTQGVAAEVSAPPTADASSTASPPAPQLSPRGALTKRLGETAGLDNVDGSELLEFVVHEISDSAECNQYSSPASNGSFRTLRITAATGNDPDGQLVLMQFGGGWEYVGPTGRSVEASTSEAAMCAYDVPQELRPNRNYEFDVVVDVPEDTSGGVLVFSPPGTPNGWEWPIAKVAS